MARVNIDLDTLTLGDMEQLETGRMRDMLAVFDKHLRIEDVALEDVPATIRAWTLAEFRQIVDAISAQMEAQTDPVRKGKN
jgi:hypothetical protein